MDQRCIRVSSGLAGETIIDPHTVCYMGHASIVPQLSHRPASSGSSGLKAFSCDSNPKASAEALARPPRVMFMYWGRRGSLPRLTLEVAHAARAMTNIDCTVSVSRQNELFHAYSDFGSSLFAIDTFDSNHGALFQFWRVPLLRKLLHEKLRSERVDAVIELMPHVWSPFVAPVIRAAGARYITVVHDADAHMGDPTSAVNGVLGCATRMADKIVTLSNAVATRLTSTGRVAEDKLVRLFHPELGYNPCRIRPAPRAGEPIRLLFLGRILPYKGLSLFLDTVEVLRAQGHPVEVGVLGEGALGADAGRLTAMGAEVVNRWLSDAEVAAALLRYDAVILSHIQASQSGVAAAAFGAGLPIVANPVGGLVEQITDGYTGVLAERADAPSLAEAVKRLMLDPALYAAICRHINTTRSQRSVSTFVDQCINQALALAPQQSNGYAARRYMNAYARRAA